MLSIETDGFRYIASIPLLRGPIYLIQVSDGDGVAMQ